MAEMPVSPAAQRARLCFQTRTTRARGAHDSFNLQRTGRQRSEPLAELGANSTEHVLNVLARLNAPPMPETVESRLHLEEAPVANTGRYDSLRGVDEGGDTTVEVDHADA